MNLKRKIHELKKFNRKVKIVKLIEEEINEINLLFNTFQDKINNLENEKNKRILSSMLDILKAEYLFKIHNTDLKDGNKDDLKEFLKLLENKKLEIIEIEPLINNEKIENNIKIRVSPFKKTEAKTAKEKIEQLQNYALIADYLNHGFNYSDENEEEKKLQKQAK